MRPFLRSGHPLSRPKSWPKRKEHRQKCTTPQTRFPCDMPAPCHQLPLPPRKPAQKITPEQMSPTLKCANTYPSSKTCMFDQAVARTYPRGNSAVLAVHSKSQQQCFSFFLGREIWQAERPESLCHSVTLLSLSSCRTHCSCHGQHQIPSSTRDITLSRAASMLEQHPCRDRAHW